jgi:hypothetical protein
MSDQERESSENKSFEWWKQFEGKPVVIQLRPGVEYIGVTYPNQPVITQTPDGHVNVHSVPFLSGELKTHGSGADFRLALITGDPNPNNPNVRFEVLLHPDDTAFVTVPQQGVIAT